MEKEAFRIGRIQERGDAEMEKCRKRKHSGIKGCSREREAGVKISL